MANDNLIHLVRGRPPVPKPQAGDVWETNYGDETHEYVILSVRTQSNNEWHALGYGPEMRLVEIGKHHIDLRQKLDTPHPIEWTYGEREAQYMVLGKDGKERPQMVNQVMWAPDDGEDSSEESEDAAGEEGEDSAPAKPKRRSRSSG